MVVLLRWWVTRKKTRKEVPLTWIFLRLFQNKIWNDFVV